MNTTELLTAFENPQVIKTLSFSEKMGGVLITAVLGMGITFLALIFIMYLIDILSNLLKEKGTVAENENKVVVAAATEEVEEEEDLTEELDNNEEIIAAITAAISLQLGGNKKFIVTNIERVQDTTPTWGKMGIVEQLSSRF